MREQSMLFAGGHMDPITISINDAAKALSLGRTTIYELIKQKRLEAKKFGRRTVITTASIHRLMAVGEDARTPIR
jgi:excisionase family DNA binding protein